MGREARCRVRAGGQAADARALLETDEVVVRGDLRLRLPFAAVRAVAVRGETLVLTGPDGAVELALGAAAAERWAARVRNPPTLRQRLGLADGATVAFVG